MQHLVMFCQIIQHAILLQYRHCITARQVLLVLVLLRTERQEIGYILLMFIHRNDCCFKLQRYDKIPKRRNFFCKMKMQYNNIFPLNIGRTSVHDNIFPINKERKWPILAIFQFYFAPLIAISISSGEYGISTIFSAHYFTYFSIPT